MQSSLISVLERACSLSNAFLLESHCTFSHEYYWFGGVIACLGQDLSWLIQRKHVTQNTLSQSHAYTVSKQALTSQRLVTLFATTDSIDASWMINLKKDCLSFVQAILVQNRKPSTWNTSRWKGLSICGVKWDLVPKTRYLTLIPKIKFVTTIGKFRVPLQSRSSSASPSNTDALPSDGTEMFLRAWSMPAYSAQNLLWFETFTTSFSSSWTHSLSPFWSAQLTTFPSESP